ncbi:ATP-dependent DNA helicase [Serratia phage Slocum]|nr:ATP-dependent DNA helicase [Serratia phage Slocum]
MKISVSNRIYFKPDEELWEYIVNQTTYRIFKPGAKFPTIYQNSGKVGNGVYWMPVTRKDLLVAKGYKLDVIDKRVSVPVDLPAPGFTLREDQQAIFNEVEDTCIINGKPGFGKTILALAIAHKLGQKTLIVCTTTTIRAQWEKEIRKWFGFEPGIIGSGKFNTEPMIVVSNIQTLNKHANALASVFGLVIVDEMHHCVATTFTNFLTFSKARYKIGLSGTLKRKDGLNVMFKDFFGDKVYSPAVNNTLPPIVHTFKIPVELSGNMQVPWADRASAVYNHQYYKEAIRELCALYSELGHKVLFVSDRTEIILELTDYLNEMFIDAEALIGTTRLDERDDIMARVADGDTMVLCASQSIFSEGVSLDELSCLILGSIVNNESLLEQLAGRIQRITKDKLHPVFVDINLTGGVAWNQSSARRAVYYNNGWEIVDMTPERLIALSKDATLCKPERLPELLKL